MILTNAQMMDANADQFRKLKTMARYILSNSKPEDWTVNTLGMLTLYAYNGIYVHLWNPLIQAEGVALIHDHAEWSFRSTIVHGKLYNWRYNRDDSGLAYASYHKQNNNFVCVEPSMRMNSICETYVSGDSYLLARGDIHHAEAVPGTVTLVTKNREEIVDQSRTLFFRPHTQENLTMIQKRPATAEEVTFSLELALSKWESV